MNKRNTRIDIYSLSVLRKEEQIKRLLVPNRIYAIHHVLAYTHTINGKTFDRVLFIQDMKIFTCDRRCRRRRRRCVFQCMLNFMIVAAGVAIFSLM